MIVNATENTEKFENIIRNSDFLGKKIYAPLNNLSFFLCARAEYGTVIWNDDVDIAPEHLYECSHPFKI